MLFYAWLSSKKVREAWPPILPDLRWEYWAHIPLLSLIWEHVWIKDSLIPREVLPRRTQHAVIYQPQALRTDTFWNVCPSHTVYLTFWMEPSKPHSSDSGETGNHLLPHPLPFIIAAFIKAFRTRIKGELTHITICPGWNVSIQPYSVCPMLCHGLRSREGREKQTHRKKKVWGGENPYWFLILGESPFLIIDYVTVYFIRK